MCRGAATRGSESGQRAGREPARCAERPPLRRPPFYQVGIGVGEAAANLAAALARNDFSGRWLIERGIHCCRELAAITVSFAHLLVFLIFGILRGFQRFIEHALVFIYPGALFKLLAGRPCRRSGHFETSQPAMPVSF